MPSALDRCLVCFAAVLLTACGGTVESNPRDDLSEHTSLIDAFPFTEKHIERATLNLGVPTDPNPLLRGWSGHIEQGYEATDDSQPVWIWAVDHQAEVECYFREVGARRLEFAMRSHRHLKENSARLRLNGHDLGILDFGPEYVVYTVKLPVEAQVQGCNVLAFEFERGVRPTELEGGSGDPRFLTGVVGILRFIAEDERVAKNAYEARELAPEGIALELNGRAIGQPSNSSFRWYGRVPRGSSFHSEVHGMKKGPSASEEVRFTVSLLREGLAPAQIAERVVAFGETASLTVSLDEFAGEIVGLELGLEDAVHPGGAHYGLWGSPILSGDVVEAPESLPAPLVEARQGLEGAPVVVTLLDACNPSFLSCYGGREGLTPYLDELAEKGALFTHAYSPAAYTIASIGTNLSGTDSWDHGAWTQATRISESAPSWAERFQDAGYRTVAIVCTPNGSSLFGFDKGFEVFQERYVDESVEKFVPYAHDVVPLLERVLAEAEDDPRPLFVWMHLLQPHEPYDPPDPWKGAFDPDYDGDVEPDTRTIREVILHKRELTERQLEHFKRAYESGLAYVDDAVRQLYEVMEASPKMEGAIRAVYSDHGEQFLTHEWPIERLLGHGASTHNDVLQIPLILNLPSQYATPGMRVDGVVAGQDLLATLADLVGVRAHEEMTAVSFSSLLFGETESKRELFIGHSCPTNGGRFDPRFAVVEDRYKLMMGRNLGASLFDLREGPVEANDLAADMPVRVKYMRQRLAEELGGDPEVQALQSVGAMTQMDASVLEQLRRLGY